MSYRPRANVLFVLVLILVGASPALAQTKSGSADFAAAVESRTPEPLDVVDFARFRKPHLSPDGRSVVVLTRRADPEENRYHVEAWRIPTDTTGGQVALDLPNGARALEWLPDGEGIAFLAPAEGGAQVWIQPLGADTTGR